MRRACTQRGGHLKTQEDDHLQVKERGLGRNQPCQRLDLELQVSSTVRQWMSVVDTTWSVVCCYGRLSKLIQRPSLGAQFKEATRHFLPPHPTLVMRTGNITLILIISLSADLLFLPSRGCSPTEQGCDRHALSLPTAAHGTWKPLSKYPPDEWTQDSTLQFIT